MLDEAIEYLKMLQLQLQVTIPAFDLRSSSLLLLAMQVL